MTKGVVIEVNDLESQKMPRLSMIASFLCASAKYSIFQSAPPPSPIPTLTKYLT